SVLRGSVLVSDSGTGVTQAVRAAETLRATAFERRFVVTSASEEAAKAAPPDPAPAEAASEAPSLAPSVPSKRESSNNDWRALAKRGALREAFASAEASGFPQACASANAS